MFKRIAGTKDILPQETIFWQHLEDTSRRIFSLYNYSQIRTPLIEEAALFNRSLGTDAEIVRKQMFLIKSKEDLYALRPEGTASIVRAYIENHLDKRGLFTKLYYIGPMFRFERPQKGRLRQFHHIGCEAIGSREAVLDVELVALAVELLKAFSINNFKIKINSLGCSADRNELAKILQKGLKGKLIHLCEECNNRYGKNILRILDCKNKPCIEITRKLDIGDSYLCSVCKEHFADVLEGLGSLGVEYEISPYLVRGLDYYNRTVFEISHSALGAQDALCAGGRYDSLVKDIGGTDAGAIGFAFGVERLMLAANQYISTAETKLVFLICLGDEAKIKGVKILADLRKAGITSDTDYQGKSLKAAMRLANDAGAKYVLLLGEDEIKKKSITLKDMSSGTQQEIMLNDLIGQLKKYGL